MAVFLFPITVKLTMMKDNVQNAMMDMYLMMEVVSGMKRTMQDQLTQVAKPGIGKTKFAYNVQNGG